MSATIKRRVCRCSIRGPIRYRQALRDGPIVPLISAAPQAASVAAIIGFGAVPAPGFIRKS